MKGNYILVLRDPINLSVYVITYRTYSCRRFIGFPYIKFNQ